jgi:hypothetical protein
MAKTARNRRHLYILQVDGGRVGPVSWTFRIPFYRHYFPDSRFSVVLRYDIT